MKKKQINESIDTEQIEKAAGMALKHFGVGGPQETITIAKNTEMIAQDRFLMLARGRGIKKPVSLLITIRTFHTYWLGLTLCNRAAGWEFREFWLCWVRPECFESK